MNSRPIIIAGSGRSGTTWVLDALAEANGLRTIFEPLNPAGVKESLNFGNQLVDENIQWPALKKYMDTVFSGDLKSLWADYRIRSDSLKLNNDFRTLKVYYKKLCKNYFTYRKIKQRKNLIVKFIRANLMLGWLSKNITPKIVLIMRHPGAVISSKLALGGKGWSHEKVLKSYINDQNIFNRYSMQLKNLDYKNLSPVAGHTIIWCIENMIPLEDSVNNGYCVVFYEDLLANGEKEWECLIQYLGLISAPNVEMLTRPSQQVSNEMRNNKFDQSRIEKWMKKLSKEDLIEVDTVLKQFEVPCYNAYSSFPTNRM